MNLDIKTIIENRLKLQTNLRILGKEFPESLTLKNKLKLDSYFWESFNSWPINKKARFIIVVGGKTNFKKTENYLTIKKTEMYD